jgi:hypothetical protein
VSGTAGGTGVSLLDLAIHELEIDLMLDEHIVDGS